ncbi:capsular biosynthesis protein [Jannaschia sp. Os4]|uniref:capsule biosynthesis protein n=1 Tax=Jannaschia sp. Os4 TaxID=2807617 RepID=UPI0019396A89|nr:capsular biosynthesis protein [Jannaschia sp. Os4]MBM2574786.1 capsular biosynthesis protein [Jannaschia sp. Os4]
MPRTVLLLQGPPGPFWRDLGRAFETAGHRVVKVNFGLGDRLFWGARAAISYRGRLEDWPAWLADLIAREGVTDVIYYADRVPQHARALDVARKARARAWAVEFGYLRPDWITLEPEGMGAVSRFPSDPAALAALAEDRPLPDMEVRHGHRWFRDEAMADVGFHLAQSASWPWWPHWRHDWPLWPPFFYLAWVAQLLRMPVQARAAEREIAALHRSGAPFDLVPLQIAEDYQIRESSRYDDLADFVDEVLASFAAHAPAGRRLLFKTHPLDVGLRRWSAVVPRMAARHGIADRVHAVRGGDLGDLLRAARGVVTVNSTVGLTALRAGCPTVAMGTAVYDAPGVTWQGGLDRFWTEAGPPDPDATDRLLRALARIQVKGSFYEPNGRRLAAAEIVRRVEDGTIHDLLSDRPRAGVKGAGNEGVSPPAPGAAPPAGPPSAEG